MDIESDIALLVELMDDSESESILSSSSDTSTESSDNEDMENVAIFAAGKDERNCIVRYLEEVVPSYTEKEFVTHFRISPQLYQRLVQNYATSEEYNKLEPRKTYSAEMHIALFLWFAGHEACAYRDLADRFNLSLGTVCFLINRALRFISSLSDSFIRWPTEDEKAVTASWINEKTGLQGVIGAIDGSHIRIDPPKVSKDDYIDRKNVTSICLQAICNENKKFVDIFVGYPGSVHDNRVLENSDVYPQLLSLCGDFFILGDSAYTCSQQIITPYRDNGHLTTKQKFFNRQLSSGRVVIEHAFGILKHRFRQLYYCKLRGIEKICHFIRACVILHNLCGEDEIEFEANETTTEESYPHNNATDQETGSGLRNRLCEEVFAKYNRS